MAYLRALIGLLLLWLVGWAPAAHAQSVICTAQNAALPSFGTVYVPSSAPVGTTFGPTVSATNTISCSKFNGASSATLAANITSAAGTYTFDTPTTGIITFQTNLTGVALQLTPSNPDTTGHTANSFPAGTITTSTPQTTQSYFAQLVKTTAGAVTTGTLNSIVLISSYSMTLNGGSGSLTNSGSLTSGTGTIKSGGCNTLNVTATLPTVFTSQLSSQGTVGGKTPVPLNFTDCPASAQISISFTGTAATIAGTPSTNVLASSGTAQNVGVQLLDSGNQPVDITGSVIATLGTASASGGLSTTYYAQYYATGSTGPGTVNAVATYTLTYQ